MLQDDARSKQSGAAEPVTHAPAPSPPDPRPLPRLWRRAGYTLTYLRALGTAIGGPDGVRSAAGRQLLRGKLRRLAICSVPGLAARLQARHGLRGGCVGCGASCNLLLRCPHWNPGNGRCNIYADRPATCRTFPITPADLDDLRRARSTTVCGYHFAPRPRPTSAESVTDHGV
jgi:hypothetical protein